MYSEDKLCFIVEPENKWTLQFPTEVGEVSLGKHPSKNTSPVQRVQLILESAIIAQFQTAPTKVGLGFEDRKVSIS